MKYDRKKIMKRAWILKKTMNIELGQAIKMSWAIEKKAVKLAEEKAKAQEEAIKEAKKVHTQMSFKEAVKSLGLDYVA